MDTIETILLILLVLDAVALIGLVLMQQGRGADIGAAFGSGSANTLFGSTGGASFMTKATSGLAIGFFVTAFGLAYIAAEKAADIRGYDFDTASSPDSAVELPLTQAESPDGLPEAVVVDDASSAEAVGDDLPTYDEGDGGEDPTSPDLPDL